jgi:hypothetical protein
MVKASSPSAKNGETSVDVKIDNEVADRLRQDGLWLEVFEEYPWVFGPPKPCHCGPRKPCVHARKPKRHWSLHGHVFAHFNGLVNGRNEKGEIQVIHHINQNKLDARVKNLKLVTRRRHAAIHHEKTRKFSRRHRHDFGSFRFRPRLPGKLKTVENDESLRALVGQTRPPRPKKHKTTGERIFAVEEILKSVFDSLVDTVTRLGLHDIGDRIPRGASSNQWRSPTSRQLGLRMPRMACDEAEAAFVLLYVLYDFDLEKVATDVEESAELLASFLRRVPVTIAIDRWVKYRRLPLVVLPRPKAKVRPQPSTRPK